MQKYTIIGNMTGNSMDAADLVLTEFSENQMKDLCAYSKPYSKNMQLKMEKLREAVFNKTKEEIEAVDDFKEIHDEYMHHLADAIGEMCERYNVNRKYVDAIGFHGKTLDHNPPSKAQKDGTYAYTLQIGSGKMLADLTGMNVVYDFRSDLIMKGLEGAPLVGPHNAHIAFVEGDGIYYNGGNTSNFAVIQKGTVVVSSDAGPCNEYIDSYMRSVCGLAYDADGNIGQKGVTDKELIQKLFHFGCAFYEMPLPKSGDPAYYRKNEILSSEILKNMRVENVVHSLEYFAAYVAAFALTLIPANIILPEHVIFFGGGWKNPIVRRSFEDILLGKGFVLAEHKTAFENLRKQFKKEINFKYSTFGTYMEARLMADLAFYKLQNKPWTDGVVCGIETKPQKGREFYDDYVNRAAKGWQKDKSDLGDNKIFEV